MTAWSSDPAGTNVEDDPADRPLPPCPGRAGPGREPVNLTALGARSTSSTRTHRHSSKCRRTEKEIEDRAAYWYAVIAPREPGTTAGQGQENLETCFDGKVASVTGPLGTVLGLEFAGMFDLSESFDDMPTRGMPRDYDGVLTIWMVDSTLGCRNGEFR